jgi:uncharacterized Zn finger protein
MCKHVAAVLYGVGARLDAEPELLFVLRGVDQGDLIAASEADLTLAQDAPGGANRLDDDDVAALFGIEMAAEMPQAAAAAAAPAARPARPVRRAKAKPAPAKRASAKKPKAKTPAPTKRPQRTGAKKPAPKKRPKRA